MRSEIQRDLEPYSRSVRLQYQTCINQHQLAQCSGVHYNEMH